MMAELAFYNENEARVYPFQPDTAGSRDPADIGTMRALADEVIVDAGFIMGIESGFADDVVRLARIERSGGKFLFEFVSSAPGLFGLPLVFERDVSSQDTTIEHVDNDPADEAVSEGSETVQCFQSLAWSGYLVTADVRPLQSLLPDDGDVIQGGPGEAVIEPAQIQSLAGRFVSRVGVANDDRTRYTAPEGCSPVNWDFTLGKTYVVEACMRGSPRFEAGFNAVVEQSSREGRITIGASRGAGKGEPTDQVPLFNAEAPPGDSDLLVGGPSCAETVKRINGVGGRTIRFLAGQGASITNGTGQHELVVDLSMADSVACQAGS